MKVGDRARIKTWDELDHGDGGWIKDFFMEHGGEVGVITMIEGNDRFDSVHLNVPSCKTHKVQVSALVPVPITWRDVPDEARIILEELNGTA